MRFLAISRPTDAATPEAVADDMDAEIANGRRLFEEGFLVQGYMDPTYTTAVFLVEAPDEASALTQFGTYLQVQSGLTTYDLTPLVGLPASEQSLTARGAAMPEWWSAP